MTQLVGLTNDTLAELDESTDGIVTELDELDGIVTGLIGDTSTVSAESSDNKASELVKSMGNTSMALVDSSKVAVLHGAY